MHVSPFNSIFVVVNQHDSNCGNNEEYLQDDVAFPLSTVFFNGISPQLPFRCGHRVCSHLQRAAYPDL